MRASANTPAETTGACVARFPVAGGLPRYNGGSASASCFSRPARRLLAFSPAWSLNRLTRPFDARVLQSISLPPRTALAATNRSDSCCAGFAPARRKRLSTAHAADRNRFPAGRAGSHSAGGSPPAAAAGPCRAPWKRAGDSARWDGSGSGSGPVRGAAACGAVAHPSQSTRRGPPPPRPRRRSRAPPAGRARTQSGSALGHRRAARLPAGRAFQCLLTRAG